MIYSIIDLLEDTINGSRRQPDNHYDFSHLVNITSDDEAYRIYMQTPGFPKSTLSIEFDNVEEGRETCPIIVLRGDLELSVNQMRYHLQEFVPAGRFERKFKLPADADTENTTASYQDGILLVRIPRKKMKPVIKTVKIN